MVCDLLTSKAYLGHFRKEKVPEIGRTGMCAWEKSKWNEERMVERGGLHLDIYYMIS